VCLRDCYRFAQIGDKYTACDGASASAVTPNLDRVLMYAPLHTYPLVRALQDRVG
jgi:hypothetical protein